MRATANAPKPRYLKNLLVNSFDSFSTSDFGCKKNIYYGGWIGLELEMGEGRGGELARFLRLGFAGKGKGERGKWIWVEVEEDLDLE